MRCLPHVFLRGGLALLLLATAGLGAWARPSHACVATHAASGTTPAAQGRC